MKKRIIILSVSIVIISVFIAFLTSSEDNSFLDDDIIYAININGITAKEFPQKGLYNVDVICENAECKWDYDEWKLKISNITGNISCGISFNSIEKRYLNDEVISLEGQVREGGQVVHETFTTSIKHPTFEATENFNSEDYVKVTNNENYPWNWNETDKKWVHQNEGDSNTNINTAINFSTKENGNYQICYKKTSKSTGDIFIIYLNGIQIKYVKDKSINDYECMVLPNIKISDTIKIAHIENKSTSSENDEVSFYLQKGIYNENASEENFDTGYRYEGSNPNNYIRFNGETWRIIGVFDENTHGQQGKLVKLVRNGIIGNLIFDSSNNSWVSSYLRTSLNEYFYKKMNATTTAYCYNQTGNAAYRKTICNYEIIGLSESYRNMIEETAWHLSGFSSKDVFDNYYQNNANSLYISERGQYKNLYYDSELENIAKIGLIYPSDYGYSVLASDCDRTTSLEKYNNKCSYNNWMWNYGDIWTITPSTDSQYSIFYLTERGILSSKTDSYGAGVLPTLYLNENVYVLDGDGSYTDPYIIAMDEA